MFSENKWIQMSKDIQYNDRSTSINTNSNLFNDINNKCSKITDKIISSSSLAKLKENKNINNKWAEQSEKLFSQKKINKNI
jgi:hypothetical protein